MAKTKKFRDYNPDQVMLLPPSPRDWLEPDHLVYFVSEVVDGFDLSAIYDSYTGLRGYPPYDPKMMVKVWMYAFMVGIHSSRKLERALHEDVGFRVLSGNQQPDFWTLSEFRRRHHEALGNLFDQTVKAAAKAGLVRLKHVCVDGTKVKANASKHRAMSYGHMLAEDKRIREEIERWFERVEANDRAEDELYGKESGWRLPPELATAEKRREFIGKFMKELEERKKAEAGDKQEKAGPKAPPRKRRPPKPAPPESQARLSFPDPDASGPPPEEQAAKPGAESPAAKPKDKDQINFTDPDSRIMRSSDKAFIQGYNAQVAVDPETHIIVACDLTNQAADSPHLGAMIERILATTGRCPRELSADAGYYSDTNVELVQGRGIEAFIPPEKIKHSEWRAQKALRGRIPKNATPKERMRRKLRTKRGRARYKLRQTSAEPVFGHIKEPMRFRQVPLRGQAKARSMWLLQCAAFNVMKLYRARRAAGRVARRAPHAVPAMA